MSNKMVVDILHEGGASDNLKGHGKTFYVGNDNNLKSPGDKAWRPTLRNALDSCVPYRGDTIIVSPKHREEIIGDGSPVADSNYAIGVAGVTIIGQGRKGARAVFRIGGTASRSLQITAPGVTIHNVDILNETDNRAKLIDVQARGFTLSHTRLTSQFDKEVLVFIQSTDISFTAGDIETTPWKTLSIADDSAAGSLKEWMVGQVVEITGGTNAVTGRHTITEITDANTLVTSDAMATGDTSDDAAGSISLCADMTITYCDIIQDTKGTAAATEGIEIAGLSENVTIDHNYMYGEWTVSAISSITLFQYNIQYLHNGIVNKENVSGGCISNTTDTDAQGVCAFNHGSCGNAVAIAIPAANLLAKNQNYFTTTVATLSGTLDPADV